jgi:hypothetical protein
MAWCSGLYFLNHRYSLIAPCCGLFETLRNLGVGPSQLGLQLLATIRPMVAATALLLRSARYMATHCTSVPFTIARSSAF